MSNCNHWRFDIINDNQHNHRYHSDVHHEEWSSYEYDIPFSIHFVLSSMFRKKTKGKITNDTFRDIVILFPLSVRFECPDRYWARFVYHCYLLVKHTIDTRRSVELIVQVLIKKHEKQFESLDSANKYHLYDIPIEKYEEWWNSVTRYILFQKIDHANDVWHDMKRSSYLFKGCQMKFQDGS